MIGVVCGPISGIMALDADSEEAKEALDSFLPENFLTPIVKTPRPGWHYWFKYFQGARNSNNGLIHVRGDGGFICVPPSKREGGKEYSWQVSLKDAMPAELPIYNKNIKELIQYSFYT